MNANTTIEIEATSAMHRNVRFLIDLHGNKAATAIFKGYVTALSFALRQLIGPRAAAELFYRLADEHVGHVEQTAGEQ